MVATQRTEGPREGKGDRLRFFWGSCTGDSWNFEAMVLFLGQRLAVLTASAVYSHAEGQASLWRAAAGLAPE